MPISLDLGWLSISKPQILDEIELYFGLSYKFFSYKDHVQFVSGQLHRIAFTYKALACLCVCVYVCMYVCVHVHMYIVPDCG